MCLYISVYVCSLYVITWLSKQVKSSTKGTIKKKILEFAVFNFFLSLFNVYNAHICNQAKDMGPSIQGTLYTLLEHPFELLWGFCEFYNFWEIL